MTIAYIIAGAGGMYCGACIRDNSTVRALRAQGCDVVAVPLYTPIRADGDDQTINRVFYGGVSVYLQQRARLFERVPRFVGRVLDSPRLLRAVGKLAGGTDPASVGDLLLSVLMGRDGRQRKELARLIDFLRTELRPRIVHLPNALFAGMAGPIRDALGAKIVCSLQGEDLFVAGLPEPQRSHARRLLREKAADVDAFLTVSHAYAAEMADYLDISPDRIHVVPLGLDAAEYPAEPSPAPTRPTVGFLARIAPEKGLHVLADAFRRLREMDGMEQCRLRAAGWLGSQHKGYLADIRRRLAGAGLGQAFEYIGEVDLKGKIEFLAGLSVLSVPTTYPEPKGLYVLESLAAGVPVVLPDRGAFPELIEATGGGILVPPDDPDALAKGLRDLLTDRAHRDRLSRAGHASVHQHRTATQMANATLAIYDAVR